MSREQLWHLIHFLLVALFTLVVTSAVDQVGLLGGVGSLLWLASVQQVLLGVAFTVKLIGHHPVDSAPIACCFCSRQATKEILGADAYASNTLYPQEHLTSDGNNVPGRQR